MIAAVRDMLLRAYVRLPEHPAKYRIVRWLGRHVFPEAGVPTRTAGDVRLRLHPRDWIEYRLLCGDRYEPRTLAFLAHNLAAGDVAVLAGVNFGQHVAVAARAVGSTGLIVGVEPQPRAVLRATANLQLNGLTDRVRLVNAALGDRDDLLPMAWSAVGNAGAASLHDQGEGFVAPVLRLSRVVEALCPRPPRLVLLDVQGYELSVLAGLDAAARPELLVVELDHDYLPRAGVKASDLLGRIVELGYELWTIEGERADVSRTAFPELNVVGVRTGARVGWPADGVEVAA